MSIFKCKICGGSLEISDGSCVAVCEYCGTRQTISKTKDDVVANLFNRANNLRLKCEFDKAEQVYEKILDIDNTDAEAHWGMVLCKYGIEYVEDKKTDSKIPTCHRTLYDSVQTDVDYLATIENADAAQKELYEAEALVIGKLQKNILNIVNNEKPFDVFICYKETDDAGKRTIDSSIANDIYYQLTQEGFKVFYAPITLEDKLGYEYEPYIFAALNSAKVMLVVGTKPEHFDAVWVRNEWSRYLKIMKTDRSKLLIPCYRDMDAYELPDEFAHLQAQDMSKIGFIQDLLRGINKLASLSKPQSTIVKETVVHNADSNITPLLKRVFIFLEDGDWNNAEEYCEKILDINPECAEAYIGKLMVELKIKTRSNLKNCKEIFENNSNYQKAIRFGNEEILSELHDVTSVIKKRNEEERLHQAYTNAIIQMDSATTEEDFRSAASMFQSLQNYKASLQKAKECLEKAERLKRRDEEIWRREAQRREEERLEKERQNELKRIRKEKAKKRNKKLAIIITPIIGLIVAFIIVLNAVIIPDSKYNAAIALMNEGKYEDALSIFLQIDGYKDSKNKIENCNEKKYENALVLIDEGKYIDANNILLSLNGHKDSLEIQKTIKNNVLIEILKLSKIGDSVKFGLYEQDNNKDNGKEEIEWMVLSKENNKVLLISKYILDNQKFNASYDNHTNTWSNSSIRSWLNNEFKNAAFNSDEIKIICDTTIKESSTTKDKIFLLSVQEANIHFKSNKARICENTEYSKYHFMADKGKWWLRTKNSWKYGTYESSNVAVVHSHGAIGAEDSGYLTEESTFYCGVRPAMWIDLSSIK